MWFWGGSGEPVSPQGRSPGALGLSATGLAPVPLWVSGLSGAPRSVVQLLHTPSAPAPRPPHISCGPLSPVVQGGTVSPPPCPRFPVEILWTLRPVSGICLTTGLSVVTTY